MQTYLWRQVEKNNLLLIPRSTGKKKSLKDNISSPHVVTLPSHVDDGAPAPKDQEEEEEVDRRRHSNGHEHLAFKWKSLKQSLVH